MAWLKELCWKTAILLKPILLVAFIGLRWASTKKNSLGKLKRVWFLANVQLRQRKSLNGMLAKWKGFRARTLGDLYRFLRLVFICRLALRLQVRRQGNSIIRKNNIRKWWNKIVSIPDYKVIEQLSCCWIAYSCCFIGNCKVFSMELQQGLEQQQRRHRHTNIASSSHNSHNYYKRSRKRKG